MTNVGTMTVTKKVITVNVDRPEDIAEIMRLAQEAGTSPHFVSRLALIRGLAGLTPAEIRAAQQKRYHPEVS